MKIGLAQINTTVGDLEGNREKILNAYRSLVEAGAEIVLYPELAVAGYPPRDLLFRSRFIHDVRESLDLIAQEVGEVPALVGFVEENPNEQGRRAYNAAAWVENGEVCHVARKCLLPTYDVFDEDRYFEPAREPLVIDWQGKRIGVTICEDLWNHPDVPTRRHYEVNPVEHLRGQGIDLLLNLSASPWHCGKQPFREKLLADAAVRCGCPLAYCNLVGGNDELVFDGHTLVFGAGGKKIAALAAFDEELRVVDTDALAVATPAACEMADIHAALVLGLRDYGKKTGFSSAVLGLSGGIDSAVTACIAADAFGADQVLGVSLPSSISSEHSRSDARKLAENLGIHYAELPVAGVVGAAEAALEPFFKDTAPGVAEENIQARSRGLLLMGLSNKFGHMLLSTGNKSEMAVGYCTLYGDMAGGLNVLADVPKMKVYALARHLNKERERIPQNTIDKPPSAELRPDQKDEDSLPPYPVLDEILRLYVEEGKSRGEIAAAGFDEAVVNDIARKVDCNEYKRKQAAPGLKITPLAFGVGRRIPIVQRYVN